MDISQHPQRVIVKQSSSEFLAKNIIFQPRIHKPPHQGHILQLCTITHKLESPSRDLSPSKAATLLGRHSTVLMKVSKKKHPITPIHHSISRPAHEISYDSS